MAKKAQQAEVVTAYKAFDKNLRCRDFQFAVGETYKHDGDVKACHAGFHACTNPFDVWSYYDLIDSRFAVVELSGALDKHDEDSKIAAAEITIKAELTLPDFIKRGVAALIDAAPAATAKGEKVQAGAGDSSKLAASGDYSQLAASGYYSKLAASGDYSQLAASGDYSVISASAPNCTAKGAAGTWISLAEFDSNAKCIGFATGCIGQGDLKPDTYYRAAGGKLVEAA